MNMLKHFVIVVSMCLLFPAITISARPFFHISFDAYAPTWISFVGVHNDSDTEYLVSGYGSRSNAIYCNSSVAAYSTAVFQWPATLSSDDPAAVISITAVPRNLLYAFANNSTAIRPDFEQGLVVTTQRYGWHTEYNDYSFYNGTRFWIVIHSDYCVELEYE